MTIVSHEVWRLVASGLLDTYIDSMVAIASRDARARLVQAGAFHANLLMVAYQSLDYVPETQSVHTLDDYLVDLVYNPREGAERPPRPTNAEGGSALTCDAPAEGFEIVVYSWDFTTFTEVGLLDEHSTPPAGFYVLATRRVSDGAVGLPSLFLEVV